jgi:NAD+ synthase (glutamine-hydrolysing)
MADCEKNTLQIKSTIEKAAAAQVKLLVLSELCITGYSLGDLFLQRTLLEATERALGELIAFSAGYDLLIVAGLPVRQGAALYNCAAVLFRGRLLGVVPKSHIPNYSEFYEARHFSGGAGVSGTITLAGSEAPFGCDLIFACGNIPDFKVGVELCEDLWVPSPPSSRLCLAGATVIANISASTYVTGKTAYRRMITSAQSGRCICGYVYSSSGSGESSTDLVYSGHLMVAENGRMLAETPGDCGMITADIDTQLLAAERRRTTTFTDDYCPGNNRIVGFMLENVEYASLQRPLERQPFVPARDDLYKERCREVLDIQCAGLGKRLVHTKARSAVVAVSGGLDSTLALLVINRAVKKYKLDCTVTAITMPGPGTTGRTRGNAGSLCEAVGAQLSVIPITQAVTTHLADIGHSGAHDTVFENAQARERMQIAMDVANMHGGLVIGTGDMSELALGFTTYNGDHMSMYGVNAGVPKTLVRHLIKYVADENAGNALLHDTLYDILATPVSPELLPAKDGQIAQITEDILGPYELHDFFLYYFLRFGFEPRKILRLALLAFDGAYEPAQINACLRTFITRFFASQFKRSCIPDGPKVGTVALSPRGDWRMPSDACASEWLKELD